MVNEKTFLFLVFRFFLDKPCGMWYTIQVVKRKRSAEYHFGV